MSVTSKSFGATDLQELVDVAAAGGQARVEAVASVGIGQAEVESS